MLQLEAIHLQRGARHVLHDINAQAKVGSLTVLLGPNGAGKSSLLALAAGELAPSAGTVRIKQHDMRTLRARQLARCRAMLPQSASLDFDFNVGDLALLGAQPFPEITPADLTKLCDSVLALVDASHLVDRAYTSLSGGERQRAQLARVLLQGLAAAATESGLLLLDEPTASLDPRHQHQLLAALQQLAHTLPLAIVASLHDVNLALRYADQVWLIDQGRMVAAGTSVQVLSPALLTQVFGLPAALVAGVGVVLG